MRPRGASGCLAVSATRSRPSPRATARTSQGLRPVSDRPATATGVRSLRARPPNRTCGFCRQHAACSSRSPFGLRSSNPVLRKFIGGRISVGSRGMAHKAIFMVQPAQNRRRDHLSVSGKAMTGGHEMVAFRRRVWNARSQASVWAIPYCPTIRSTPPVGYLFIEHTSRGPSPISQPLIARTSCPCCRIRCSSS